MADVNIAIFGYGQIGKGVYKIVKGLVNYHRIVCSDLRNYPMVIDSVISADDQIDSICNMDLSSSTIDEITRILVSSKITHVINALPFSFNEKIATASRNAKCSYIDFTEDDVMADKVQAIYKDSGLNCAVKCGLAPGFINYIGLELVKKIHNPQSLMVSVGALPKMVSFDPESPESSYNLSWSVDGLVNEYIRPCRVRDNGTISEVEALSGVETVIIDGLAYEAAHTSGGVGSLINDLPDVPSVHYKTLRYPGHYAYVKNVVDTYNGDFGGIKAEFIRAFPYNDQDVIIVYAKATGSDKSGKQIVRNYSSRFYGIDGLTGIQATTAGSGVAIFEMMLGEKIKGVINHSDIDFNKFVGTRSFKTYYSEQ